MSPDYLAVPPIDRPDFHDRLAAGEFGRWMGHAWWLSTQGYCTLEIEDEAFADDCRTVIAAFERTLAEDLRQWEAGRGGAPRVQDGWQTLEAVRRLSLHPEVLDLLRVVYGREPFAFQTLNFAVGSEQPFHSDAVHFHSLPEGFLCGLWIPLADVEPDSGPLTYFAGSHRLPYLSAGSLGLTPERVAAEAHPQSFFEPVWQREVARLGLQPQAFLPKRGQVLFWHANLLHGGSPVANRRARRWSQVVHYFFEDCLHTTPLNSFPLERGGPCLRNPFDIARGRRRWSPADWSALDLTATPFFQQSQATSEQEIDGQEGMVPVASPPVGRGGDAPAGQP